MSGMKTMQAFKFRICPTPVPSAPSLPPCGVRAVRLEQGIGPPEGTGRRGDPPFVLRGSGQAPDALEKQLGVWLPVQGAGPSAAVGPHRFLDRALWDGLTKKKGFPRFKKKRNGDVLRFPDALQIKLDMTEKDPDGRGVFPRIFVPKVGGIRFRKSREICGMGKNITVTCKAGRWSVSVQTEREVPEPTTGIASEVGLDLGVATFATLSDGTRIHPAPDLVEAMKRAEERLSWEQRKLSRKYRKGAKSRDFA